MHRRDKGRKFRVNWKILQSALDDHRYSALSPPFPSHNGPDVLFDLLAAGDCTHCCLLKVTCWWNYRNFISVLGSEIMNSKFRGKTWLIRDLQQCGFWKLCYVPLISLKIIGWQDFLEMGRIVKTVCGDQLGNDYFYHNPSKRPLFMLFGDKRRLYLGSYNKC